jgi:hypothetical protein
LLVRSGGVLIPPSEPNGGWFANFHKTAGFCPFSDNVWNRLVSWGKNRNQMGEKKRGNTKAKSTKEVTSSIKTQQGMWLDRGDF